MTRLESLRREARRYLDKGFAPLPIIRGQKTPAISFWKPYQAKLPSSRDVDRWFSPRGLPDDVDGVAVISNSAGSHLAIVDYDSESAYEKWQRKNKALARELPTAQTARGKHLWFLSDLPQIIKLDCGEFRGGGCYTIAPCSVHPSGHIYAWIICLPYCKLPLVDPSVFGIDPSKVRRQNQVNVTEQQSMALRCSVTKLAACLCNNKANVEEVIQATIPDSTGQRNEKLMLLARALKFNLKETKSKDGRLLKPIFLQWHRQALPIIGTKSIDESWSDFLRAHDNARHGVGGSLVDVALTQMNLDGLPAAAAEYEQPTKILAALCRALAELNDGKRFFLSCHDAEKLGMERMQAWRLLRLLEKDKIIRQSKVGNEFRATRYEWIAR